MSTLDSQDRRTLPLASRLVVAAIGLLLLGAAVQIQAQAPGQQPDAAQTGATSNVPFEFASIKRNKLVEAERLAIPPNVPVVPGRAQTLRGGYLRGRGMTVRELIRDAYGYRNREQSALVGAPDWVSTERYDVDAKASVDFPASTTVGLPPSGEAALRALLAERFSLKVRVEQQRRPVYELVLHRADGRLGANLVPAKGECVPFFQREAVNVGLVIAAPADGDAAPLPPCLLGVGFMGISGSNLSMPDWARLMALRPQLNRTVIDRTGLAGRFDITLRYFEGDVPGPADLLPAIKPLLESQLGLTLRDAEAPVEILMIENVDRPTEN